MDDLRLIRLSKPVEVRMPMGWRASVNRVDECILDAVRRLAAGEGRVEIKTAWVDARIRNKAGQSARLRFDLCCDCENCEGRGMLLTLLEEMLLRARQLKPKAEAGGQKLSSWPYVEQR